VSIAELLQAGHAAVAGVAEKLQRSNAAGLYLRSSGNCQTIPLSTM
jgi:hypothetical protein